MAISSCAQTLYALRVLRAHGLHDCALQNIYRSVVVAKLVYASSSWIDFSNATNRQKLQGGSTWLEGGSGIPVQSEGA